MTHKNPRQDPDGTGALTLIEYFQIPFPRWESLENASKICTPDCYHKFTRLFVVICNKCRLRVTRKSVVEVLSLVVQGKERWVVGARYCENTIFLLSDSQIQLDLAVDPREVLLGPCFAESLSKAFARQKATYAFELDGGGGGGWVGDGAGDGKGPFESPWVMYQA